MGSPNIHCSIPKVSVIIPVYNAERYLAECLDSLVAQTLPECEFIFVNDGSSDGSRYIVENYQRKNIRIILINQPNLGVSSARNAGLAAATGEYVGFVDADDWVEPDMFATLYSAASACRLDVVFSNFYSYQQGKSIRNSCSFPKDVVLNRQYIIENILPVYLESDMLNSVCNKLFRHELLVDEHVAFPTGVELGEDGMFNMKALSFSKSAAYIEYTGYHYRETAGSATRNAAQKDYFLRALEVYTAKLPPYYARHIEEEQVHVLKSIRFVHSIISCIHIYYSENNGLTLLQKFKYVKKMISNPSTCEALILFQRASGVKLGRYEKTILFMMRRKSALALFGITAYSRVRNKQAIGG